MSIYKLEFEVRDNEIDIQGVVNNANYAIYYAHTRHKYAKEMGLSFSEMAEEKQYLYLIESHQIFKKPLKSQDQFYVTCKLVPVSECRFAFEQEIRRLPDEILIAKSHNICVCIDGNNRNRPYIPEIIKNTFDVIDDRGSS